MKRSFLGLGALVVGGLTILGAAPQPAFSHETGLAQALHDMRREGRKMCLSSHFHDGYSSAQPSRKLAQAAAIRAWAEFTAFEYGTAWAHWRKAGSKKVSCEASGGSWSCQATARPCK